MSSEIRIKQKHFILFITFIFFLFLYVIRREGGGCDQEPRKRFRDYTELPTIFAITPTYARPVQKAELTRLAHALRLSPNVFWVIVEDANQKSSLVKNLLQKNDLLDRSVVLNAKTPDNFKLKDKDPNWLKPRGVEQRNAALEWVRQNLQSKQDTGKYQHSLVYFMDDDNTYSTQLFEEITKIERGRVGVWPVGLVGGLKAERPVLNEENMVLGFNSAWRPERPFPLDMAGFALSSDLLLQHPEAMFSYEVERGYQESEILRHLTVVHDLQPLAKMCTEILVWHTRTETPKLDAEKKLEKEGKRSDGNLEV